MDAEAKAACLESIEDLTDRIRRGEFHGFCFIAIGDDGETVALGAAGKVFASVPDIVSVLQELAKALKHKAAQ